MLQVIVIVYPQGFTWLLSCSRGNRRTTDDVQSLWDTFILDSPGSKLGSLTQHWPPLSPSHVEMILSYSEVILYNIQQSKTRCITTSKQGEYGMNSEKIKNLIWCSCTCTAAFFTETTQPTLHKKRNFILIGLDIFSDKNAIFYKVNFDIWYLN